MLPTLQFHPFIIPFRFVQFQFFRSVYFSFSFLLFDAPISERRRRVRHWWLITSAYSFKAMTHQERSLFFIFPGYFTFILERNFTWKYFPHFLNITGRYRLPVQREKIRTVPFMGLNFPRNSFWENWLGEKLFSSKDVSILENWFSNWRFIMDCPVTLNGLSCYAVYYGYTGIPRVDFWSCNAFEGYYVTIYYMYSMRHTVCCFSPCSNSSKARDQKFRVYSAKNDENCFDFNIGTLYK